MIHYVTFIDDENPLVKYSMPMNSSSITGHIAGFTREFDITKWWNLSADLMLRNRKTRYEESGVKKAYRSTAYFADITNYFTFGNTSGAKSVFTERPRRKSTIRRYSPFTVSARKFINIS